MTRMVAKAYKEFVAEYVRDHAALRLLSYDLNRKRKANVEGLGGGE
jgi:hypothetical protein